MHGCWDGCGGLGFELDWTGHRRISRSSSYQEPGGLRFHVEDEVNLKTVYGSCERQTLSVDDVSPVSTGRRSQVTT